MVKITPLSSAANPLLKDVRRAISRGTLTENGLAVAEGLHLLEEALRSRCDIPWVLAAESARPRVEHVPVTQMAILPDALFESITSTETTQGVIALVRPPEWKFDDMVRGQALLVVLDGIQDPGNAGSIVRSAEAFAATGVIFLKGTASPFHPKTLRASAGSLFRVPFLSVATLRANDLPIYAAMPFSPSVMLASETDLTRPCALIIGSEGQGIRPELREIALPVTIPTVAVESLNAATAASILLYEAHFQRRGRV